MRKFIFTFLALALGSIFTLSTAQTGQKWMKKVSPSLLDQTRNGKAAPFLILLTNQADVSGAAQLHTKEGKGTFVFHALHQTARQSQKNITAFLDAQMVAYQSLYIVNAIRVEGSQDLIQSLANRPEVSKVLTDPVMRFSKPVDVGVPEVDGRSAVEWGIEMINADHVWAMGYTGQNISVGGEDTGYEWGHPALKSKYRGYDIALDTVDHNYNWHDAIHAPNPMNGDSINPCGFDSKEPCDDHGHGTHTMGTMIGSDGENQIGVAPDARWCACRNMERAYGTPFTYIECFEWFLAPTDLNNENPDPMKAPHVINNSWGCPPVEGCDPTNFELMNIAVNNLRAAGIVVVVSAGNDGSGCSSIANPASIFEESFTVGATRSNDTIAGYSSRGPVLSDQSNRMKPNVSAPGSGIRSSVRGGGYDFSSGTSMAGPHVAGLVALMISANPNLAGQVDLIEDIIESTAIPKTTDQQCGEIPGSEVPNHTYGYGRVDALAAVEAALALVETGIQDDPATSGIKVYPNPFRNQLLVLLDHPAGKGSITLADMQGRELYFQVLEGSSQTVHESDVYDLPSGFYLYTITAGTSVLHGKIIKAE